MPDSPDSQNIKSDANRPNDGHDDSMGGLDLGAAPNNKALNETPEKISENPAYRVLARKYRPQNFKELIGQDAMVQTLGNAIKRGRLAHAFLMTGVRGVGKTSTARLIAKALNCVGPDGQGGATIDPCGVCEPCQAIAEGRHIDVIEMDAASHTGVDDVRDIIEAVRYASVSARYKIYIIDEVHMLSKNAFNALLKTLEEPPPHVKFLFATTEVNKVPITVLSRCQRFDLKRISIKELADHFAHIVKLENVKAQDEALALIARSAEGSVRDGLSILDQAIAHADWSNDNGQDLMVTAAQVRDMLGLSDRSAIRNLLGALLSANVAQVMEIARSQYQLGIEPYAIISGLLREVHMITLAKLNILNDPAMAIEAKTIMAEWGDSLSFPQLHRLWQLLLKGHEEIQKAAMPSEACDMALLRILHASSMPDPSQLLQLLQNGGAENDGRENSGRENGSAASGGADMASGAVMNGMSSAALEQAQHNPKDKAIALADSDKVVENEDQISDHNIDSNPSDGIDIMADNLRHDALMSAEQSAQTIENNESQNNISISDDRDVSDSLPATFEALLDRVSERDLLLDGELRDIMRLVKYEPPLLEYQLSGRSSPGFEDRLRKTLTDISGASWTLREVQDGQAMPSQLEQKHIEIENRKQALLDTPMVKAALAAFPEAHFDDNNEHYKRSIGT